MVPIKRKNFLLVVIIFSQFAGTSLWFAGNAIIDQINTSEDHSAITTNIQLGFIAGTLVFSLLTIADRFRSSMVFFLSSVLAALANLLIIWLGKEEFYLLTLRFITGFFLAGIYPVGMKIAADVFPDKMGKVLGFLVGALVLGTSFPHLVRSQLESIDWKVVLVITSLLSIGGGVLILSQIPRTHVKAAIKKQDPVAAFRVFRSKPLRSAAFGYFGHMWELYAFWAMLPTIFSRYNSLVNKWANVYFWSFLVIAVGSAGCALGGLLSQKIKSKTIAYFSLLLSGLCSLLAPFLFYSDDYIFYTVLLLWGLTVTADSPQFSTLVATYAEDKHRGTALTIVTSLGFAVTIISILLVSELFKTYGEKSLWILSLGPLFGLFALKKPH